MLAKQISDDVRQELENLDKYRTADGVVLTTIDLHKVVDLITSGGAVALEFLEVQTGRRLVKTDDGIQLIADTVIQTKSFAYIRDLDIQSCGGGVFEFTASYTEERFPGDHDSRPYSVTHRFHVNNQGRATFVVVRS